MSNDKKQYAVAPNQSEDTELADAASDAIAREAMDEARHMGEAQRYRNNPGPVVPPQLSVLAP